MGKTYSAIIKGNPCEIVGFDAQGHLVLADGERYIFKRFPTDQQKDEPTGDVFRWRLLEAARLTRCQDDWKWNNESLPLQKWRRLEEQRFYTKRGIPQQHRTGKATLKAFRRAKAGECHPEYMTRSIVDLRPRDFSDDVQALVAGVAWFEHDDGTGGWNTPVFLSEFRPVLASEAKLTAETRLAAAEKDNETERLRAKNRRDSERLERERSKQSVSRAEVIQELKVKTDRGVRKICTRHDVKWPEFRGELDELKAKHERRKKTVADASSKRIKARAAKRRNGRGNPDEEDFEKDY